MMNIAIDTDVPVAPRRSVYPWASMNVGDSFYVEADPQTVRGSAQYQQKRYDRVYTIRKDGTGARVWRLS